MITLEIDPASSRALRIKLDRSREGIAKGLSAGVRAATIWLATHIKRDLLSGQLVNRRTGNLSRAVFSKMDGPYVGLVGVGGEAPYGRFVNDGTAPHVIEATRAKALRFVMNGNVMFRKKVNHPGIRARHFMEQGLITGAEQMKKIIHDRVTKAMQAGDVIE
jgi:hypothetical protein